MSKNDRDRYESEKLDMKLRKGSEDTHDKDHCILETVKNRSKVISKMREQRKFSDDFIEQQMLHNHGKKTKRRKSHL